MYEQGLIEDNNALKCLYNKKDILYNLIYSLRDNSSFLLREENYYYYYYYFLANRTSVNVNGQEKDYTDINNVFSWIQNNLNLKKA